MPRSPRSAPPKGFRALARVLGVPAAALGLFLLPAIARAQGAPVTFSATGDYPYGSSEIGIFQQHMDQHDLYSPSDFLVHVGDINAEWEGCSESRYVTVADMLKSLSVPAFIIPGDNEWIDCSSPGQGWQWWQESFADFEGNFCLPFDVERQSVRRENWAFVHQGVLFCGINLPDGDVGDAVPRQQDDAGWVSFQMQDKDAQVRACVVFGHAGPSSQRTTFFNAFVSASADFGKPVLYIMGNDHDWLYDSPWPQPNMRRLTVMAGGDEAPVQVTVGMSATNPWSFVRSPWSNNPALTNHAPCANAGPDIVAASSPVALPGVATDDGPPSSPAGLTVTWSTLSGPGTVSFADAHAAATTASFSTAGTYALRLSASDGAKSASDDVLVTIGTAPPTHALSVDAMGGGAVALSPSGGTYPAGTVVTLDAQPDAGWLFEGWSGDLSGSLDPATITMNGDRAVTATFAPSNVVVLEAQDDSYTRSSRATSNYGTQSTVRVRSGSTEYRSYVKFDAAGLAPVARATLRLYATDGSVDAGTVYQTSVNYAGTSTPWTENGITWNNAPAAGTPLAALGSVSTSTWVEVDVTAAVSGTGPVSFAILPASTDLAQFSSHEGSAAPQLVLEKESGPVTNEPDIAVTPASHDYGSVVLGSVASRTFEVANAGSAPLQVSSIALDVAGSPGFTLDSGGGPVVLDPGQVRSVVVSFAPFTLGAASGAFVVSSDDPDEPTVVVPLAGSGAEVPLATGEVAFEEVVSGGSTGAPVVTGSLGGGVAQLYVATLTSKPHEPAAAVSGLGLTWTRITSQCAGRGQTGLDVWVAFGDAGGGPVTVTPGPASKSAFVGVARYSGAKAAMPVGAILSGNTNGVDGACSGGTDGSAYSFALPVSGAGSMVWSAAALRNRSHTPGPGFTEILEGASGSGGDTAGLAIQQRASAGPGAATVDGSLGGTVDWAVVALEIAPAPAGDFPDIAAAPGSIDFGDVVAGATSAPRTVTISNTGTADLGVNALTLGGPDAAAFSMSGATAPFTLAPGEGATIDLAFLPPDPGARSAMLTIQSDDPDEGSLTVPLSGNSVAPPPPPAPDIAVSPATHDFGDVLLGADATASFAVANAGTATLSVASVSLLGPDAAAFSLPADPGAFTLAPGETLVVGVAFAPTALGAKAATLRIASDDPDMPTVDVALSGSGIDAPVPHVAAGPASHDFGDAFLGTSATTSIAVTNTGGATLSVASVTVVGPDAAEFPLPADPGAFTLAPGETLAVDVEFAPATAGPKSATLRIASDDPDAPVTDVALSGNGVEPPVGGGAVVYEESVTGGAVSTATVTTSGPLAAAAGDLYLACIATKPYRGATAVDGMGLAWSPVASRCAGRSQTGVEVWMARGSPSAGAVTATLEADVQSVAIAVSRYSGVDAASPLGAVTTANTNGVDGSCSGGTDGSSCSFPLDVSADGAFAFAAVAMRNRSYEPGAGFVERALSVAGTSGGTAALSVVDREVSPAATIVVDGAFSGSVDWAVVALEIRPGAVVRTGGPAVADAGRLLEAGNGGDLASPPAELSLAGIHPNPFRTGTVIEYALPADTDVSIAIYDVTGRVVRHLMDGRQRAGRRSAQWSGRDDAGSPVSSGVYFVRWRAGDRVETRKVVLTR